MAKNIQWLLEQIDNPNMAADLDESTLNKIGSDAKSGYDLDEESRTEWKTKTEDGLKIAKQLVEDKTYPWVGASNVKHPLIAISAIQFAARAYPELVKGTEIVKAKVMGADPEQRKALRAKRVSNYMSWQCMEQITEWDADTDVLLHGLPIMGNYFRKSYWSPVLQRIRKDLVTPLNLVVNEHLHLLVPVNSDSPSLKVIQILEGKGVT